MSEIIETHNKAELIELAIARPLAIGLCVCVCVFGAISALTIMTFEPGR